MTKPINDATLLPDLVIEFDNIKEPKIFPEEKGKVNVVVTNQGTKEIKEPLDINFYASTDSVLNSNDELLGSLNRQRINLEPGESKTFNLNFASPEFRTPSTVAPGAYYLLAEVDSSKTIPESNETNNLDSELVSAKGTDVVLDWNATLLNAVATDRTAPPVAARSMAMVHGAIYDAVMQLIRHTATIM